MVSDKDLKLKVLKVIMDCLDKIYGKGIIMFMGDFIVQDIEVILIGFLGFDIVLGIGGFLCGWVVEIYGLELLGKIILVIYVIVECQKLGGIVVFIDVEYVFDCYYVRNFGVDIENLLIFQLDNGE